MAEPRLSVARPTPLDLPSFLPYASAQLQAPYRVRVLIETQEEYVSKAEEKGKKGGKAKSTMMPQATSRTRVESPERSRDEESGSPPPTYSDSDELLVGAVHDNAQRLLELRFQRCRDIPRLLMQILALCVPHQPLLTKLTVRWVPLRGEALHEIAKFIPHSQLTDVCLDDSPVPEKNYRSLLAHEQLRSLSLARCDLDDEDCVAIAEALAHPLPASRNLALLSLVGNAIADAGACALAVALRSNRSLQHLNLAGNRVSDVGAAAIFRTMAEFPLTYSELTTKRRRFVEFLRQRKEVYLRCLSSLTAAGAAEDSGRSGGGGKRRTLLSARARRQSLASPALSVGSGPSTLDTLALRADAMAAEAVGSYSDPFGLEETLSRDGYVHSLGNTTLCYLNLAYNELGYASVVALLEVLQYQGALVRKAGSGLLRVLLDGNSLPESCDEYAALHELLERAVLWKLSKPLKKVEKSKSRTK